MFTKLKISGNVVVETGMHIGGSTAFAAIGTVDSPVMKDPRTNMPIIPGSSLKGKMRTLLAKEYNEVIAKNPDDDCERLTRLFGSAKKNAVKRSRVIISDMHMINAKELRDAGVQSITEIKFENTINRATAVANPRQIERVIRGSAFGMEIIYDVENEDELIDDIEVLATGFKLLQYDFLGGNGSRGYGKIRFDSLKIEPVIGSVSDDKLSKCRELLSL